MRENLEFNKIQDDIFDSMVVVRFRVSNSDLPEKVLGIETSTLENCGFNLMRLEEQTANVSMHVTHTLAHFGVYGIYDTQIQT